MTAKPMIRRNSHYGAIMKAFIMNNQPFVVYTLQSTHKVDEQPCRSVSIVDRLERKRASRKPHIGMRVVGFALRRSVVGCAKRPWKRPT